MSKRITQIVKNGVTYNIGSVNQKELNEAITAQTSPLSGAVSTLETSKQNKLTAGVGIEITEANVINVTIDHTLFEVVEELPAAPDVNKIYLLVNPSGEGQNLFTEYIYVNSSWEKVGEFKADTDLSDYYKKSEVDALISDVQEDCDDKVDNATYTAYTSATNTTITGIQSDVSDLETSKVDKETGKSLLADTDKAVYDATVAAVTQIPSIYESKVDGAKHIDQVLTQAEYDALETKESVTTYFIYKNED